MLSSKVIIRPFNAILLYFIPFYILLMNYLFKFSTCMSQNQGQHSLLLL